MIRELRKSDAPRLFDLLKVGFPEEEALLGSTPEGITQVARRVFRWDLQLVIRLARLFGRPLFRFFVVEEDGRVVATTILSFPERAGYVSTVMVDPAYRRRGFAQALVERSAEVTRRTGRKYLVLHVLRPNAPAITLYEKLGFRRVGDGSSFLAREATEPVTGGVSPHVRPFERRDARDLVPIAQRALPPEVREVLPYRESALRGSDFVDRALGSVSSGWVVDRGNGAEAHLAANAGGVATAGHFSEPIVGEGVGTDDVAALVRTALEWCLARRVPRILAHVGAANARGRSALESGGFREALNDWLMVRTLA